MVTGVGQSSEEQLLAFKGMLSGELLGPDDAATRGRRVHNGLIDRRPALIARCRNTADSPTPFATRARAGSRSRSAAAATTSPAARSPTAR